MTCGVGFGEGAVGEVGFTLKPLPEHDDPAGHLSALCISADLMSSSATVMGFKASCRRS
jgi:hypothetical protein